MFFLKKLIFFKGTVFDKNTKLVTAIMSEQKNQGLNTISMKLNYISLIIFLVVIFSCKQNDKISSGLKVIELNETKDILPISSFIEDISYVELKFVDDKTFKGKIIDLKKNGNDLVVKFKKGPEFNYLRFSINGKFLNEIAKGSKSNTIVDIPRDIIEFNRDFAVWNSSGVHLISKSGKYKKPLFKADLPGNRFFYSRKKFYLFHESAAPGFLGQYSVSGKPEKVFSPHKNGVANLGYSKVEKVGKDKFHLFSPLNDTIFSFSGNHLKAQYVFKTKQYPSLMQILKQTGNSDKYESLKFLNNNRHVVVKNYLENNKYIFLTYWMGSKSINLIVNKTNWETTYFAQGINDIDGGIWGNPVYLSNDNILYIPISSYKITSHKIVNEKRKGFNSIKEQSEKTGNPVLLLCKLK